MSGRRLGNATCRILIVASVLLSILPDSAAEERGRRPIAPEAWTLEVEKGIAESEYAITWQESSPFTGVGAAWQAPNRAQGFRSWFLPGGVRVVPRTGDGSAWTLGLVLEGYGRGNRQEASSPAALASEGSRIEYRRGAMVESFVNSSAGLEHRFTLAAPPERGDAPEPVQLVLRLDGTLRASVAEGGGEVLVFDPSGQLVLRYTSLGARDAAGRELPTHFEGVADAQGGAIRIVVDDAQAVWPVTVHRLLTAPAAVLNGDQAGAAFATQVVAAGDVNGDGFGDLIVGAPRYDNGQADEGRAFAFLGGASGPSTVAHWTAEVNQAQAYFGDAVGTAGDVNGDGYADVLVGADFWSGGETNEGGAWLYLGSASGVSSSPAWHTESNQSFAFYGLPATTAGDVNGDGYSDVIVGAAFWENASNFIVGKAYVYLGSASGLPTVAAWTVEGNQDYGYFGYAAGTAGDVNGDGYSDVVIGADGYDNGQINEGRAYLYQGSPSGLGGSPAWVAEGNQAAAAFGYAVGTAGDVNGDGYTDVIVGAYGHDNGQTDEGRAYVYHGSAAGLAASPAWIVESDQAGGQMGFSVQTAGDVNGDGFGDVIVGAPLFDNGQVDEGRAYVYEGSASGLATAAAWTAESDQAGASLGGSVAVAGDVNGDGYSDVIVGAPSYDNPALEAGSAFVYRGSPSGLAATPSWAAAGGQEESAFGIAVAAAGDVDGDGYGDVLVGAPFFDAGQTDEGRAFVYRGSASGLATAAVWFQDGNQTGAYFGDFVARAGDVNGDGYDDVAVAATYYDGAATDDGRVFVYLGSASGPSTIAAWTNDGGQAGANLGFGIGGAGDVNGDGYADLMVGALQYDNGQTDEGRAWLFLGGASGLSGTAAWTAESNQSGASFGYAVGSAGDVNRDGFSDVFVTAPYFDDGHLDEGAVWIYLGGESGIAPAAPLVLQSNQPLAEFGISAASAGDVNGDGYSDLIVGADLFDAGELDEGAAFVYLGGPSGTAAAPSWTIESNQEVAELGGSVAGAGDVNGDGFADVIVGARLYDNSQGDEGRAWVYLGSATGLSTLPSWTADGGQEGAEFAGAVAGAGDVNGDGYADVVVGAWRRDGALVDEGGSTAFYGSAGRSLSVRPQQRRADGSAPIAHLGASPSPSSFRLAALGRTPFGRGKVKLEWEVKPLGTAFDGTGLGRSASWISTGTAGAALDEVVSSLVPATPYHWRIRVLYDTAATPFARASRWIAVPWNGREEEDLRTVVQGAGAVPDNRYVGGTPLTLAKAGANVTLSWGPSCLVTDIDYEVYYGIIGSFGFHAPVQCSTGGATSVTIAPSGPALYYLVVPRTATLEGSYGARSGGAERPASPAACLRQVRTPCP